MKRIRPQLHCSRLSFFLLLAVLAVSGCSQADRQRSAVRDALQEMLLGYDCGEDVVAAILAEKGDALVSVYGAGMGQAVDVYIRRAAGNAARCEWIAWEGTQRHRPRLVYEVPDAGATLAALYALVEHDPAARGPYITDTGESAHLTIGSRWRLSAIGTLPFRSFVRLPCHRSDDSLADDEGAETMLDTEAEDEAAEQRKWDADEAYWVLKSPEALAKQTQTDLFVTLFDRAGEMWQAAQPAIPQEPEEVVTSQPVTDDGRPHDVDPMQNPIIKKAYKRGWRPPAD